LYRYNAASKRFLDIQQAYNSLMTTDEEQTVEALTVRLHSC
jgi:hypothetical protein